MWLLIYKKKKIIPINGNENQILIQKCIRTSFTFSLDGLKYDDPNSYLDNMNSYT